MRESKFHSVEEALPVLRGRTGRVVRITGTREPFSFRMHSVAFGGINLSRSWESNGVFEIDGQPVPVVFIPIAGNTVLCTSKGEQTLSPSTGPCFTVAEPATFRPAEGYSEIVLRLDEGKLAANLRLLDVEVPLAQALTMAALRTNLPGMDQIRRLALEALEERLPVADPFQQRLHGAIEEMLCLRAAYALAAATRLPVVEIAAHRALGEAIGFIHARYLDAITVGEIAVAAGISIRLLQLLFRRHLEATPLEYIRRLRLANARRLLEQGLSPSVTEAALDSGFNHLGEFSQAYVRRFGEKPSDTLRQRSVGMVSARRRLQNRALSPTVP